MNLKIRLILVFSVALHCSMVMAQRDPLKWPFSRTSIWNMPISKNAQYVPAKIGASVNGFFADEEVLIFKPTAPLTAIYENFADWDRTKDRCIKQGKLLFSAPIPANFVYSKNEWSGLTPNSGMVVLMSDGVTLKQTQPFARCTAGADATSHYVFADQTLTGDGLRGAHGGSGLSTVGGTIRLGELVPGGKIRHALKIDIYGSKYMYYDSATKGYRWPAFTADAYASSNYGTKGTPVPDCRMGALLALPPTITLAQLDLKTEPAKIIAEAMMNYGAYLVDDSGWDAVNICTEHGPDGTVLKEFVKVWGFPFEGGATATFSKDLNIILTQLQVVVNNTSTTIGGGPNSDETNRLAPMSCELGTVGSGLGCSGLTGIENIYKNNSGIKVFPEPLINGDLKIQLEQAGKSISLELFSLTGTKIWSETNSEDRLVSIPSGIFPTAGIYILRVSSKNEFTQFKISYLGT